MLAAKTAALKVPTLKTFAVFYDLMHFLGLLLSASADSHFCSCNKIIHAILPFFRCLFVDFYLCASTSHNELQTIGIRQC